MFPFDSSFSAFTRVVRSREQNRLTLRRKNTNSGLIWFGLGEESEGRVDSGFEDLIERLENGDEAANAELFELVYSELHRIARAQMRKEAPGHTLQPTALVNEAYLRLFQGQSKWESRGHFFGAAAEAMRRVLIDYARRKQAEKRGARPERVTMKDLSIQIDEHSDVDILMLDESLSALDAHDQRLALVVKLRYFVHLNIEETADVLGVSPATVKRDWTYARAWLFDHMSR